MMILTDKPSYIETPPDDTQLMHYLNIYQLLSMLKTSECVFSPVSLYEDPAEATLSVPSYNEVCKHLLWQDPTPVLQDEYYCKHQKKMSFASEILYSYKPNLHVDTFAYLISSFVRHFMLTHCWSVASTENILMWDRYRHQNATLAIKTTIGAMKNAFYTSNNLLYIGEIQYKDYKTEHINKFDEFSNENLSDPVIIEELFYQPILHKQKLYEAENEVRIIMSYRYITNQIWGRPMLNDIPFYNKELGVIIDPYSQKEALTPDGHLVVRTPNNSYQLQRRKQVSVDPKLLIENIILSPYTESYALPIIQDAVKQYGIDPNKVVESSIKLR